MKFTINSAPAPNHKKPPNLVRAEELMRKQKDGQLVTVSQLAGMLGLALKTVSQIVVCFDPHLRTKYGRNMLYGNPKTIAAFRKQQKI